MTKRTIIPLLIAALVALLLPWLAVTFAKGDNGMAVIFLLFFAVNPITAVLLGVFSGGNVRMVCSSRCYSPRCSCWARGCSSPWQKWRLCSTPLLT